MLNHYRMFLRWLPFVAAALLSVNVLFTPASGVPSAPPGTDKVIHFLLFTALMWTGRIAGSRIRPLWIGLVCYAVASEVLQASLPLGRSGEVADAVFDVLGILLGTALHAFGRWFVHARRRWLPD